MTLPRPYFEHAGITLYCGDSREIVPLLDGDAFLTDPFYGIDGGRGGYARMHGKGDYIGAWEDTPEHVEAVCVPIVADLAARLKRGAVTPGNRCLMLYPKPSDVGCFWTPSAMGTGPWGFTTFHPILYYGRDYRAGKGALPSGRQVTEVAEKNGHPCPKPLKAWTWLLDKVSQPGETVIDPFCGSGTTLRAAVATGRRAIGVEIEERYCEIAARSLLQIAYSDVSCFARTSVVIR